MAYTDTIKQILKDVALEGAIVVPKKKLLWLLDWGQDRRGAWSDLLIHWEAIGEKRDVLMGMEVGDKIVLSLTPTNDTTKHQKVSSWA